MPAPSLPLVSPGAPDPFAPGGGPYIPALLTSKTTIPPFVPTGEQLFYSSTAVQTTVAQDLGAVLAVNSNTGFPTQYPFTLLLEWGTANQEVVTVLSPANVTPYSYNVLRGQDGTTQVTHTAGAQVNHGVSARDFFQIMPVFNVCAYGADPTGNKDSYLAIQTAMTDAMNSGGGIVYLQSGTYLVSNICQIGSNTWLQGAGMGTTTIRMMGYSWVNVTQVSVNVTGISAVQAYNPQISSINPSQTQTINPVTLNQVNNVRVSGITFDGNQQGVLVLPSWANQQSCSPLGLDSTNNVIVDSCQVINSIGYSIYLFACTNFAISNCRVLSGQISNTLPWGTPTQQDGIHVSNCQTGIITGNTINTGSTANVGDDAIALQSWASGPQTLNTVISGNVIAASAEGGIDLAMSGGPVSNVTITGNIISQIQSDGFLMRPYYTGATIVSNVTFTGNVLSNVGLNGVANGVTLSDYSIQGYPVAPGWSDIVIAGNSFNNFNSATQFGIYAVNGTGLQINDNNFDNWNANAGIQIGDDHSGTAIPVNNYQVSGNTINMSSASAGSSVFGILVSESYNGIISGNTIIGPGAGETNTWGVLVLGTVASPYGNVVQGNRITGWLNPCGEYNNGTAPDYNDFTGNLVHGCGTGGIPVTGAHTLAQTGIVDLGGVPDTEQFVCLTSPYTLASQTTAQKLFNASSNGALTLGVGTWFFESQFQITGMSATSGNASFGLLGAGNASISSVAWTAIGLDATTQTTGAAAGISFQVASTSVGNIVTAAVGTGLGALIKGVVRVGTAGTIIPSVALTTAAAATVSTNSFFRIWPVSASTATTFVGNWS